jgi:co-chaperonin GroES (HSP10)
MTTSIEDVKILGDKILVFETEFGGRKTAGGIMLRDDDMKLEGARPRWAKVLAVGPKVENVKVGQYILQAHGSWTRGFSMLKNNEKVVARMIDSKDTLMIADEPTLEYNQSEKI